MRVWTLTCMNGGDGEFACQGVFSTQAKAQEAMRADVESWASDLTEAGGVEGGSRAEIREGGAELLDSEGSALLEWAIDSHELDG